MKKILLLSGFFAIFLTGLMSPCAHAGSVSLDTVVAALQKPFQSETKQNRIRDFQAKFSQEAYLSSLDQVQTASGRVTVRFADSKACAARFRWEYLLPDPQLIVSDGKTVWVYMPENRQVIESPMPASDQTGTDNPLAFLTDLGNLSRQFSITWGEPRQSPEGHYRLVLRPRQPSAFLEQLLLEVDQAVVAGKLVYPLRAATLFGASDNRTVVRFSEPRLNQGPGENLFRFKAPAGTEVLRPEQNAFGQ
jgi:outer membrane lipoprotein carrier protein